MSFRSTAAAKVMPANSDQSRAPYTSRRTQDGDSGGTNPPKRFRLSAASSASTASTGNMGARLTSSDHLADTSVMPSSIFSNSRKQQPPPLATSHSTHSAAANDASNVPSTHDTQHAGPRSFLQTRRRHPSTNNAKLPLGPRPIDLQNTNNR